MARAETASASLRSDSIKGLAQSIANPAYRRLLTAEPVLRRAVPVLIVAFMLTICIGAAVQVLEHRRQVILDSVRTSEALADHLILSRDCARAITGTRSPAQAVRKLARPDRQVAVVTCGDEGCWYLAQGDAVPRRQPAFKVEAVDTTGCGDVFHGAYAFALARGLGLEDRIRFAAAAAALKATRPGGQAGIPSLRAVRRFLNHELETETR